MINCDQNMRLFHRDLLLQDNGTFTIGTFMRIIVPHRIIQEIQGIPLVCSDAPALILTTPTVCPKCIIITTFFEIGYKSKPEIKMLKN